jgi:choline dehydrogenase-like flavoprotein
MQIYVRGSRADYDGWESLGNKGWGWEGMAPYFRKFMTPMETSIPTNSSCPMLRRKTITAMMAQYTPASMTTMR